MSILVLRAYVWLIQFDVYLAHGNFKALYDKVRKYPIRQILVPANAVEQICTAVDMACIWYWKEVLCLQRSAATACLLKRCGEGTRNQSLGDDAPRFSQRQHDHGTVGTCFWQHYHLAVTAQVPTSLRRDAPARDCARQKRLR